MNTVLNKPVRYTRLGGAYCHPQRARSARGLCNQCYYKVYFAERPGLKEKYVARQHAKHNTPYWRGKKRKYWRRSHLKKHFGLSLEEYNAILTKQDGRCAVCKVEAKSQKTRLAVDHDHKSKNIRGLLCVRCNLLLGLIEKLGEQAVVSAFSYLGVLKAAD